MNISQVFHSYELLVDKADSVFRKMEEAHGSCIKCKRHCSDCCHAVFGLFLIEAASLQEHFSQLDNDKRHAALLKCNQADRDLKRLETRLRAHEDDPQMRAYVLARERIRCPLLNDNQDCLLYPYRPITCRVYGIPIKIKGKARACGKARFKKGESYPAFDLDSVYRDLFILSKELLNSAGKEDSERASLLISVSKAIRTPSKDLMNKSL